MSRLSLLLRLRSAEAAARQAGDNLRRAENQVLRLRDAAAAAAQDVAAAKVAVREEEAEEELNRQLNADKLRNKMDTVSVIRSYPQFQQLQKPRIKFKTNNFGGIYVSELVGINWESLSMPWLTALAQGRR